MPTHKKIDQLVQSNRVVLFMKGTPEFPQCGFSQQVSTILNHLNCEFVAINVLLDDEVRQGIKDYANWPTIPQLYVAGEFVGGCDIIREMYDNDELQPLLAPQG